jgi:hypothetical protein
MIGSYDLKLVALSLAVAAFASYTALDLAGRVSASRGRAARIWLVAGAVAMGAGIWSMHFIGMLAFSLPGLRLAYDLPVTLLSMFAAIVVSGPCPVRGATAEVDGRKSDCRWDPDGRRDLRHALHRHGGDAHVPGDRV